VISRFACAGLNLATVGALIGLHAVALIPMTGAMVTDAQQTTCTAAAT